MAVPSPWLRSDHTLTVLSLLPERNEFSLSKTKIDLTLAVCPCKETQMVDLNKQKVRIMNLESSSSTHLKRLQLDLFETEKTVLVSSANFMFPISQPIASEMSILIRHFFLY